LPRSHDLPGCTFQLLACERTICYLRRSSRRLAERRARVLSLLGPTSLERGAGYRGQPLSKRLNNAEEITATSVNGSTTSTANHDPRCSSAGHIARAIPGG